MDRSWTRVFKEPQPHQVSSVETVVYLIIDTDVSEQSQSETETERSKSSSESDAFGIEQILQQQGTALRRTPRKPNQQAEYRYNAGGTSP